MNATNAADPNDEKDEVSNNLASVCRAAMGRLKPEDLNDHTLTRNTPFQSILAGPERGQQTPAAETARKEQPRVRLVVYTQPGQIGIHVVSFLEHSNCKQISRYVDGSAFRQAVGISMIRDQDECCSLLQLR